jgi:positive regulator of sigma E activity
MIEQQGRVVREMAGNAVVMVGGQSGCPACDAGKGCGAGVFGKLLQRREMTLVLVNSLEARPGQTVILGIAENLFLRLLLRLYIWPLLAALFGAACGHYLASQFTATSSIIDIASLVMALFFGWLALSINKSKPGMVSLSPEVVPSMVQLIRFPDVQQGQTCSPGKGQ